MTRQTYGEIETRLAPYEPGACDLNCLGVWMDQRRPCTLLIGCIGEETVIVQMGFDLDSYQARRRTDDVSEALAECIRKREAFEADGNG
jgi:hypothetical protein